VAKKKKKNIARKIFLSFILFIVLMGAAGSLAWKYRYPLYSKYQNYIPISVVKYMRSMRPTQHLDPNIPFKQHHMTVATHNSAAVFGIDVSHYQDIIDWSKVENIPGLRPVEFVFIRATMGRSKRDSYFTYNWKSTKGKFLRGAYHYYRPDENSLLQADNFIKVVTLEEGDLPPVLDIEKMPKGQSMDSLKIGLKRWLNKVENHYKVRPIIYSGDHYFNNFLEKEFADYTLWIANYNRSLKAPKKHWKMWQYSEKGVIDGINEFVDLNLFDGSLEELKGMTKK